MTAKIKALTVEMPGRVMRTFNDKNGVTEMTVNEAQARALFDQLSPVLMFFDSQADEKDGEGRIFSDR